MQLLPTPGDVRGEVQSQRHEKAWYERAFEFIDQLTFGQSIRGALKGFANGPMEALTAFIKNAPFAYYAVGEDVMTADIREAWGDTNARDGVKNAIWNTIGDIVSNPLMLFGSPFAVTKAGMAAARLAGATRYAQGAAMSAEALKLAEGLTSIGKGLETGQRAMYTFNMFGKELFSLGKIPQGVNPLGFRSMYVPIGNLIDSFFSLLHSNPILKPISGVFTFATGIGDPLKRAMFGGATRAAENARNATMQSLQNIYEASTKPEFRQWIAKESGGWNALLTGAQVGMNRMDEGASFVNAVENSHLWIGNGKKQALMQKDPRFVNLMTKAWEEVAQPTGQPAPAIRELYETYHVPLDTDMLIHADLKPRFGVELPIAEKPTFAESIFSAEGRGAGQPEAARAQIGAEIRGKIKGVLGKAHEETLSSYAFIQREVGAGNTSWSDINGWLKSHMDAMDAASEMGILGGMLGQSLEPAVGPYVHSIMNPRLGKILDNQLFRGSEAYGGKKAMNIVSSFMKDEHYGSLTTAERNAIFWELGTKLTAFKPLKEIVAADTAGHSIVDHIEAKLFDLPFVKALRRSKEPGDVDLANLFITNPVLNDYHRIWEAGQQAGARALFSAVFKGPIPVDEIDLGRDVDKILEYERMGHKIIVPNPSPGKIMETRHVGAYAQDVLDAERRAQMAQARATIRGDMEGRIAAKTTDWASQQKHFREATRMTPENVAASQLVESTADNFGVARVKGGLRDILDSRARTETLEAIGVGRVPPELKARADAEIQNLGVAWADQGMKEQAAITARIDSHKKLLATIEERQAALAEEAKGLRSTARDPELRSWQQSGGEANQIERGRLRMTRREISQVIEDNEALLAGKHKDQASYTSQSITEKLADEKRLQKSIGQKVDDFKFALRDEADSIQGNIDTIAGQEKFQAKQGRADLSRLRGKQLSAMEMNTEIAVLHEAQQRGGLALTGLSPELRAQYMGKPGKAYVFKADDWDAVERFWKHWNHADDWGDNRIVSALRTMRTVWAPYVAANGFGLMTRMRDATANHLMYEFGGAWKSIPSRIRSYIHADSLARGFTKALDDPAAKEAFAKGVFKTIGADGAEVSYTHPELLQFLQNRGVAGAPAMAGELVVRAGDMMSLGQAGKFSPKELIEPGKVFGKETVIPRAITDFPSALLPLRRSENSVYGRWGMHMAQWVDDRSRIAGFIGKLDQGSTLDEAADFALKWGYDSRRNITTLERQRIATFIPFYSWAKFAISRSVETFFKHPGRIAWINTGRQNFMKSVLPGETDANPADIEAILPRYISQQYGVPFKNGAKGPEFFLLGSWLPTNEMQQMVDGLQGGAAGIASYVGQKLHPAIGTAIEIARNKSFYNDNTLESFEGQHDEFMGMAINKRVTARVLQNFRFLYELDRQNLLGVSEAQSLRHGTATEDDPSYLTRLAQSAFGIMPRTYPLAIEQAVRVQKREQLQELGRLSGLLKNRVAHPERTVSSEDADALSLLIKRGVAGLARTEAVGQAFPPDQPAQKKKRRKFGPLTESLTPQ